MCLCSWSLGANSTICSILWLADDQPDPKVPGAVIRVIVGTVTSSRGSCAAVLPRGESARLRSAAPSGSSPQLFLRAITLLLSCSCVLVTRRDIQTVNISRWSFFFISSAWTSLQLAPSFSRQATWTIWGRRLHAHPGRHPASAGRAALSVVSQSNEADLALFLSTHVHDYIFTDYTHPFFTWMIFFLSFFGWQLNTDVPGNQYISQGTQWVYDPNQNPRSVEIFGSGTQDAWELVHMTGLDYLWIRFERNQNPEVCKHTHEINSNHLCEG